MTELKYSIIVPVFNRPDEIGELLRSLSLQAYGNFEVIVVEDGSELTCKEQVNMYSQKMNLCYFYKHNSGPGDSRNYGATKASGDYLIFFDSDCIIPSNYLTVVTDFLSNQKLDLFGGPDKAHDEFNYTQKAINYAMTSFLTTGGIRGHKKAARGFQPRSFNMGINRKVFADVGGFANLHPGEDPDLVYRVTKLGYTKGLITEAFVYHKRRINLNKFSLQVYQFGLARTILMKWHPASRQLVFWIPSLILLVAICMVLIGWKHTVLWYLMGSGLMIVLLDALRCTGNIYTAILGVLATIVQISSYGWGFIRGWWSLLLFGRQPQKQFPQMFMGPKTENA